MHFEVGRIMLIRLLILLAFGVLWLAGGAGASVPEQSRCPAVWDWYLSKISENYSADIDESRPVLFSDSNGNLFDCLGANISDQLYAAVEQQERQIAAIIQRTQRRQENGWLSNWCTIGTTGTSQITITIVSLPYDIGVLDSQTCRSRILNFSNDLE